MTNAGTDPLLSTEENCGHHIEPPNELELNNAFTRRMNHLLCVMKALHRFKALRAKRRLAKGLSVNDTPSSTSSDTEKAGFDPSEQKAKADEIEALLARRRRFLSRDEGSSMDTGEKGRAHDVVDQEPLFLGIGTGARDDFSMDEATPNIVADSPTAVDFDVYDRAYEDAVEEQLKSSQASKPTLYLTRLVKDKDHLRNLENLLDGSRLPAASAVSAGSKLADLVVSKVGLASPPEPVDPKADAGE